ncbi:MAG: 23S rRNA (uracil(1939)-C(5))-methyltransferase RlmD [Succinivibrio sp.]
MVTFFKPPKKTVVKKAFKVTCNDLDLQGRGVASTGDLTCFVEGLMPGDVANIQEVNTKGKICTARITKIITPSPDRILSKCPHSQLCGGCPMDFVPENMLLSSKIEGIKRLFNKTLKTDLKDCDFVLEGNENSYRRACRLAIRGDHGKMHLGFREKSSDKLVKIDSCMCVTDRINSMIGPVNDLLNTLSVKGKLGHVEFLDSDGALGVLIRVTAKVSADDESKIVKFAEKHNLVVSVVEPYRDPRVQSNEIGTRERIVAGKKEDLFITSDGIRIECMPSSFVQVNRDVNELMIKKVIELTQSGSDKKVLDLFCGLGNFTFPLAKTGADVVGVDIVSRMVVDARENAKKHNLPNATFEVADLEDLFENQNWAKRDYDSVVMDPGRAGAKRATLFMTKKKPNRIVYISCNPLAASRDSFELLQNGYTIEKWGVLNMFPKTTHIEMILSFVRTKK